MKKLAFILILLAGFAFGAAAQENSFNKSVSFSIGGVTGMDADGLFINSYDPYSLAGIYEPTWSDVSYLPVFSLDGDWILGRWIDVSLSLSYSSMKAEKQKLEGNTIKSFGYSKALQLCLVPGIKVLWANQERFKLYSGFDIGAEARWIIDDGKPDFNLGAAWDLVPIGARFKFIDNYGLYTFTEGMIGRRVLGVRFGFGFAF